MLFIEILNTISIFQTDYFPNIWELTGKTHQTGDETYTKKSSSETTKTSSTEGVEHILVVTRGCSTSGPPAAAIVKENWLGEPLNTRSLFHFLSCIQG